MQKTKTTKKPNTAKNRKLENSIAKSKTAEKKLKTELKRTAKKPAEKPIEKPVNRNVLTASQLQTAIEAEETDIFIIDVSIPILSHDNKVDRIEKNLKDYTEFEQSTSYNQFEAIVLTPDLIVLKGNRTLDYLRKKSITKKGSENYQFCKIRIEYNSTNQQISALYTNNTKADNLKAFLQLCLTFPQITISGKADKYLYVIGLWIYSLNSLFTIDLKDIEGKLSFKYYWNCATAAMRNKIYALVPPVSYNLLRGKLILKTAKSKKDITNNIESIRAKGFKINKKGESTPLDWQTKFVEQLSAIPSESVLSQWIKKATPRPKIKKKDEVKPDATEEEASTDSNNSTDSTDAKPEKPSASIDLLNQVQDEVKAEEALAEKPLTTTSANIDLQPNLKKLKTELKKELKKDEHTSLQSISLAMQTLLILAYASGFNKIVLSSTAEFAICLQNICKSDIAKDLINDEEARGKILTYSDDDDIINSFLGLYHLKITEIGITRIVNFTD